MVGKRPRLLTLSVKESLILDLLTERGELYGLQLVATSRRKLKRGTVYVTLGRMEQKGYITSRLEDAPANVGGMPRRQDWRRSDVASTQAARHAADVAGVLQAAR